MNLQRTLLTFILVSAFSAEAATQETPKAELFDEFGSISCEDLLARTDSFFADLSRHPNHLGYAVIYSSGRNPKAYKRIVSAHVYMRRFDSTRIRIVTASDSMGETAGRLWRVPPSADPPNFTEIEEPKRDVSKPFLFGSDFTDNVCPTFIPRDFVELIRSEPGSIAKIVISGSTWRDRKEQAKVELLALINLGLTPKRIKFYFVHRPNSGFTEVNYWFVPARGIR
jgi:hypothetical protein